MKTLLLSLLLLRPYEISLPVNMDSPALIIVLHGHGGTALGLPSIVGQPENTIVIAPYGLGQSWNGNNCCGYAYQNDVDDVAAISDLIDNMIDGGCDPDRVFILGLSNGGMLAHKLAGALSHKIAAIADISGCIGGKASPYMDVAMPDQPSESVSIFIAHGVLDEVVPFAQDWEAPASRWDLPFMTGVKFWRTACRYDMEAATEYGDDYEMRRYYPTERDAQRPRALMTMIFPGGKHDLARWPEIMKRVLKFFERHPKTRDRRRK